MLLCSDYSPYPLSSYYTFTNTGFSCFFFPPSLTSVHILNPAVAAADTLLCTTTASADAMVRSAEFSQLAAQISSLTSSFHQDDPLAISLSDTRKYLR